MDKTEYRRQVMWLMPLEGDKRIEKLQELIDKIKETNK